MSKPDKGDIAHKKGYRQRARVRGREMLEKQRKLRKPKPTGRKRS